MSRFLDHWKPDAAVWVESELWPNMISQAALRGIPLALINARMSTRSEHNWRYGGDAIRQLLSCFSLCLAQTPNDAACFNRLGARDAVYVGNMKYSAAPPPVRAEDIVTLSDSIGERPVWMAASTHPGDEDIALQTHRRLLEKYPTVLTMIALRHPNRLEEVLQQNGNSDLKFACRSRDTVPDADTSVFLIDTLGEMGLFYRQCPIVLVCGSFSDRGGHNPIEPAMLGSAILHGPDMRNFETVVEELRSAKAALLVQNSEETAQAVSDLLSDPARVKALSVAARKVAEENAGVIDRIMERINAMISEPGPCKPV